MRKKGSSVRFLKYGKVRKFPLSSERKDLEKVVNCAFGREDWEMDKLEARKGAKMRKRVSLALAISLALMLPELALAAVKSGAKCAKVNSTQTVNGKKFTCIKSGTKLIWNKGVAVATSSAPSTALAPVTQAKPNPFDTTPFPDDFTRPEMIEAMFKSFDEFIKGTPNDNSYKIIIDSKFQTDSAAITKLVQDVYSILPFPAGYPTTVVILSDDRELIEKTVKENGFGKEGFQQTGYHCRDCAGYGWATSSTPLTSVTPHELFHVWQKAAYKRETDNNLDPSNPLNSPIWFDEGGANFFGEAIFSKTSKVYQGPRVRWQSTYKLKDYVTRDKDRSLPYDLGHAASEYIVASKGVNKFLEIYLNFGKGQDFPTAFNNALGITLDNFYEKFDRNLKKIL